MPLIKSLEHRSKEHLNCLLFCLSYFEVFSTDVDLSAIGRSWYIQVKLLRDRLGDSSTRLTITRLIYFRGDFPSSWQLPWPGGLGTVTTSSGGGDEAWL